MRRREVEVLLDRIERVYRTLSESQQAYADLLKQYRTQEIQHKIDLQKLDDKFNDAIVETQMERRYVANAQLDREEVPDVDYP